MTLRRDWFAQAQRLLGIGAAAREVAREAERVVARAATCERLAAVEGEIAFLLVDDRVPARGRRLWALEQARDDLRAELGSAGPG
ncbi:hypothetical protein EV188_103142 [Actinomycetospora succinea]|uniref:Uncharacterized protein n=1 Tax=Actinomycetospora succinea TaxID=663603 RepID=A0A4R6VMS1_9PSEU|nr:hypothetical protein [Actinomycetospora succinea]TDQ60645.1 hypothetical protein EV188_103142 [Actinomycetospora succinea]